MSKWLTRIVIVIWVAGLWIAVTSVIFALKNLSATETERFLHIPRSFILDFKE